VHTSEEYFRKHLRDIHDIHEETRMEICMRAYQMQHERGMGWCGFCLKSVPFAEAPSKIGDKANVQTGYGTYNGRANHIDMHVSREGRNMDSYVSLEYHLKNKDTKPDDILIWFNAQRPADRDGRIHNPNHVHKNRKRKRIDGSSDSDSDERKKKLNEAKWTCVSVFRASYFVPLSVGKLNEKLPPSFHVRPALTYESLTNKHTVPMRKLLWLRPPFLLPRLLTPTLHPLHAGRRARHHPCSTTAPRTQPAA
jgi:hypothetical protein